MGRADEMGVVGVFLQIEACAGAIRALEAAGEPRPRVYSPVPSHEIAEALRQRPSPLGWATLAGALVGLACGIGLSAFTALKYDLITGGKPLLAWIPWFIVGFEFTILFGCLANFLVMLLLAGLPRFKGSPGYDERFSKDAFGIFVCCEAGRAEKVKSILHEQGAEEVRDHV